MKANLPSNEEARLAALRNYCILDTLPEQAFDDLTLLASQICGTPITLVSLIDSERQWFKSKRGLSVDETSRDIAFCAHALLEPDELFIVPDARKDERFANNPLVTGDLNIQFYMGAPLVTSTGEALGTLCVIDQKPRQLSEEQKQALKALARQTMAQLEFRRHSIELVNQMAVRVQTEAALRESEERFQAFMNHSPIVAFLKDEQGRYTYVNRPFLQRFGIEANQIIGRDDLALWPELAPQLREQDLSVIAGREMLSVLETAKGAEGTTRYWQVYKFPLPRGGGQSRLVAGVGIDITENKQYQEQLEEYQRKLEESMDRKDEFVSIVSHELRTPLTSVYGSLGLLVGGVVGTLPDSALAILEIAQRNSKRLLTLLNDILDLQKIESGRLELQMEELEMGQLMRGAIEANASYGAQCTVSFVTGEATPELWVYSDSARLNQVLSNLLSNAAKFSPEGAQVTVNLQKRDGAARIEVHNQGPGIPQEFQARIFQKFAQAESSIESTTNRRPVGTGLGLSICKAIMEQLNGVIGFETGPQTGTTFFFEVPLLAIPIGTFATSAQ